MSLILDALSRAEREKRSRDGVPDILAAPGTTAPGQRFDHRMAVAAGFALLALVLAGVLLWPRAERTPPAAVLPASTSKSAVEPASVAPEKQPVYAAAPGAAGQPAPAVAEDVAALYAQAVATERQQGAAAVPNPAPDPTPTQTTDGEKPAVAQPVPAAVAPARSETPVDLDQVLREARRASANASLSEHPVPVLDSFSQQFRDRVPTLMYLRHDYAGDASSSSVLINGEILRVGQRTGAVQVVEILPDSVILRFDGQDFRLRALNSWVNL